MNLSVSNITTDLCEQDIDIMFDRFWRKDQARSGSGHAGLGLSLVKALADVLNINIHPLLTKDSRFTLSLSGLAVA